MDTSISSTHPSGATSSEEDFILRLIDVHTHFESRGGIVRAVDGVTLDIRRGEILGLVGESGCGKSTLSRTIMQLEPPRSGTIVLEDLELTRLPWWKIRRQRLNFQMVFQDPYASLNPRMTVYSTLAEAIRTRHRVSGAALIERVGDLMERVGLERRFMKKYPHEFSGGQRQRIAVARALAPEPKLMIADEPISALDVSIQSQILNLLQRLVRDLGLTMLFISHDLSVVHYIADRIAVMHAGKIIELGTADEIMNRPQQQYTQVLLEAIPRVRTR
ncbi:MAG TPA: ATP-binding cassette domain-containing protein [Verrucomicrobiales bacterium]|nr:ATP-binding cassette domain-containing protein [Verrucomicrobiales bacterium]